MRNAIVLALLLLLAGCYYPPYYYSPYYGYPAYGYPATYAPSYGYQAPQPQYAAPSYASGGAATDTNNCGTPDQWRPCPPMPRVPLQYYPPSRQ
jgi:hypothetical protein